MASEAVSEDGGISKKIKLSDDKGTVSDPVAEDLSSHARITSLEGFKLKQILSDNSRSKSVFVEGCFEPSTDSAVVLLDKLPVSKNSIDKLLNNTDLVLNLKSKSSTNYANGTDYVCYPQVDRGDVKATVIYPATPKHVEKYLFQPLHVVHETPHMYETIVLPHILSQNLSIQWVYNILEHESEADRIVFEDSDPENGFIMLPDLKWDESKTDSIYLIAICQSRNIKSLRDLRPCHIPLLNNIRTKGLEVIFKKYHIPPENIRIYLHYQPSYYHLHVHFSSVKSLAPGAQLGRAHLLDTVIQNIELCSSYYEKATLTYTLKQNDPLLTKLREATVIST